MKTNNTSTFRLALAIIVSTALTTPRLHAQTITSDASATTVRPSLKTAIWTTPNSSSVRISFVKKGRGAVHVRLYDSQGIIVYDRYEYAPMFMGKYDLSELPAGVYTIDLYHADDHVSQPISLSTPQPEPMHVALLKAATAGNPFITVK